MDPLEQYLSEKTSGNDPLAAYISQKSPAPPVSANPASPEGRRFAAGKPPLPRSMTGPADVSDVTIPQEFVPPNIGGAAARIRLGLPQLPGVINSALDRATFGGLTGVMRLSDKINTATGRNPLYAPALADIEQYRVEHPLVSGWTDAPAYFTGPTNKVVQGADAVVRAAESKLPAIVKSAMNAVPRQAAVARNLVTAGGAGATIGGANALTAGEPGAVPEAMAEGAQGAAALSVPLSVGAAAVGGAGRAITESRGGKARQYLESQGVEVSPTTPGRGGPMQSMVTTGTSDADIGAQGEASAKRGLGMLKEEKGAILGALGRRIGRVAETPQAAQMRDVTDVVTQMRDAVNELDTTPQARAAMGDLLQSVEAKQGAGFNPDTDNYLLSETDLNKLRRGLDRYAKTGTSTDASLGPLKSAAHETRSMVSEGPFADVNADYSKESKHYQASRRLLGINERPRTPDETQAAVNKVKNAIIRRGQNTVTAGGQEGNLAEFEARHPDIGQEFAKPEILRKRADISFHLLPQHGGLIDRMTGGHRHAAALLAGSIGGVTGIVPPLVMSNLPAIQARLLYGPALAAQAAEPMLLGEVPQIAARMMLEGPRRRDVQEGR